jgi:hypothetical protein
VAHHHGTCSRSQPVNPDITLQTTHELSYKTPLLNQDNQTTDREITPVGLLRKSPANCLWQRKLTILLCSTYIYNVLWTLLVADLCCSCCLFFKLVTSVAYFNMLCVTFDIRGWAPLIIPVKFPTAKFLSTLGLIQRYCSGH